MTTNKLFEKGVYDFSIPFDANAPAGHYLVTVRWSGGKLTKKLVKL